MTFWYSTFNAPFNFDMQYVILILDIQCNMPVLPTIWHDIRNFGMNWKPYNYNSLKCTHLCTHSVITKNFCEPFFFQYIVNRLMQNMHRIIMKHLLFDLIVQKHFRHLKYSIFPYVFTYYRSRMGVCSNYCYTICWGNYL